MAVACGLTIGAFGPRHAKRRRVRIGLTAPTNAYTFRNTAYAAYGQGTYKLNESGLSATAGLRYTIDERGKTLDPPDSFRVANPTAPSGFSYDQKATYKRLSWQFGLQNQINSNLMVYAFTRRAYRAGGYNGTVVPRIGFADIAGDSYAAERVTDVEAGAKFQGRVGPMPARFSVAAFNYWIKNAQRLAFTLANGNPSSLTVNVPNGKTWGAEFEAQISPAPWLTLGGAYNYIRARYNPDTVFVNGDPQVFDQVPDTPESSGNLYADITVPLAGNVVGTLHGDVYAQSRTFVSPRSGNRFGTVIDGYAVANFRVGLVDRHSGWSLTANLKNAFDRRYYVGGLATGEIFQINILVPAEPRTFSVDARFKF